MASAWEEPVGQSPTTDTKFRRIFDEHFEAITRYCLRRLPSADVNDAAAEVFLVAWKKLDRVPTGDETLPWLYGVARNVVRNADRSSRRSGRLAGKLGGLAPQAAPGPDVQVVRRHEDDALLRALASLKVEDQEVLRLRAYEGMAAPQIALVLGCSTEAAKKRISRALGRLRKAANLSQPDGSGLNPRTTSKGGER